LQSIPIELGDLQRRSIRLPRSINLFAEIHYPRISNDDRVFMG
jgi:hypothetical protein